MYNEVNYNGRTSYVSIYSTVVFHRKDCKAYMTLSATC